MTLHRQPFRQGARLAITLLALAVAMLPANAAESPGKGHLGSLKRVALVVGNSAYQTVPALPNPANDAAATKEALQQAGFEVVHVADANAAAMRASLDSFTRKVEQAGAGTSAVVFYAGHAVQMAGVNYLLPVDIKPEKGSDMPTLAVSLSDILKRLDATAATTKIVILDACRDNPFAAAGRARGLAMTLLDGAARDDEAGLARIESKGGTLVAFSTSPGATAADGAGEHSPFAAAFLKLVREPGLPVEQLFRRVRLAVHDVTGGEQTPWETSSLTADFKFIDGPAPVVPGTTIAGIDPISTGSTASLTRAAFSGVPGTAAYEKAIYWDSSLGYRLFLQSYPDDGHALRIVRTLTQRQEETAWAEAVRAGDAEAYRLFIRVYPGSQHAAEAEALGAKAPKRLIRSATLVCPIPTAPKLRKTDLREPAPVVHPKVQVRRANAEPALVRRTVTLARPSAAPQGHTRSTFDPGSIIRTGNGFVGAGRVFPNFATSRGTAPMPAPAPTPSPAATPAPTVPSASVAPSARVVPSPVVPSVPVAPSAPSGSTVPVTPASTRTGTGFTVPAPTALTRIMSSGASIAQQLVRQPAFTPALH